MPRSPSPQPTEVELEILQVLWQHGPCALGEIHAALAAHSERAYSTKRKMVQVMREKGLVSSDDSVRPQRYFAAICDKYSFEHFLAFFFQTRIPAGFRSFFLRPPAFIRG